MPVTRRELIQSTGAIGTIAGLFFPEATKAEQLKAHVLTAGSASIDVNGRSAKVYRLTNNLGTSGLRLAPGERFKVDLLNKIETKTIIHWHGQLPPWTQDGFPWPQTPPLLPNAMKSYDFKPISGTYWMHSHHGLQEQNLMTAPLIIHSSDDMRADHQEIILMLHDFSFTPPEQLLGNLTGLSAESIHQAINETENAAPPSPNYIDTIKQDNQSLPMAGMTQKPKMAMNKMAMQGGMGTDLNDISYDAFLANDRTLEDPDVIRIEPRGRVKLRIINAASSSQFWIDLGKLTGRAVAVDGHDILPIPGQFFPLATAQRLDVIIDLPQSGAFPVLARLEGDYKTTGIILATKGAHITTLESSLVKRAPALDNSFEKILNAARPLSAKPADIVHRMVLDGGMNPYKWSINGAYWPNIVPMMVSYGKRVEVEIINNSMMAHPMHLHGHAFQVVQINGHAISGAVRDTVLVPPMMGSVKIAFDADNPGRWAFHCHNLYHMMSGMMTELRYESIDI